MAALAAGTGAFRSSGCADISAVLAARTGPLETSPSVEMSVVLAPAGTGPFEGARSVVFLPASAVPMEPCDTLGFAEISVLVVVWVGLSETS